MSPPPPSSSTPTISSEAIQKVLPPTLYRLTNALPKSELDVIIREARACETALEKEIELLERELGMNSNNDNTNNNGGQLPSKKRKLNDNNDTTTTTTSTNNSPEQLVEPSIAIPLLPTAYQPGQTEINYLDSIEQILGTDFSPPDRYFTVSALLGRLRIPLKLPATTSAAAAAAAVKGRKKTTVPKSKKEEMEIEKKAKQVKLSFEKQQALLTLDQNNDQYHKEHTETTILLALWKRISSHRTSAVFRKPVDPAMAPGYKERILFPIDLSLIRKMIVCRMIKSFAAFHRCVGLICHNCVKFNGRESDYSALTRDFEDNVDEKVLEAVRNATSAAAAAEAAAGAAAKAAAATDVATAASAAPPAAAAGTNGTV